ncbi:MAG: hypothetical protein IPM66_02010 [Acidobacteriota bacterium]|nr:MAG: hypothetical protein IPM66_02010 [Acidobacteriota bacterium]
MRMTGQSTAVLRGLKHQGARLAMMLAVLVLFWTVSGAQGKPARPIESLTAEEFTRLINELSEDGGYFRSDNFTSNETAYLTVVDLLREMGATGGAYLGVGPEQNFTYIAKIRPQIAFIVDIRRQAIMQHLMYKAIFHNSPDRVQFLSKLFSRPLTGNKAPTGESQLNDMLAYINRTPTDDKVFSSNMDELIRTIEKDFKFPLNENDRKSIEYVYRSFHHDGLEISYRMDGYWGSNFPTFREIIEQTDQHGRQGNFLASNEDYQFVRDLHRKNLIIPVVGNFAGARALAAVGDYLRKNGYTVTAFYTSNVEQYLFSSEVFPGFAANVKKLPINEKSLFIRSATGRFNHPARLAGHRASTLLQKIQVFVKDFDAGLYESYIDLVMTNFIAPDIR